MSALVVAVMGNVQNMGFGVLYYLCKGYVIAEANQNMYLLSRSYLGSHTLLLYLLADVRRLTSSIQD